MKVFRECGDRKIVLTNPPLFPIALAIYYACLSERIVFPVYNHSVNWIANKKKDIFFVNIIIARTFIVFTTWLQAESRLSSLGKLSLFHSRHWNNIYQLSLKSRFKLKNG